MSRYIKVEDAIEAAISGCASWDGGYFPSMDEPIKEEFEAVDDKCIDVVRCRECKWAEVDAWWTYCKLGHKEDTTNSIIYTCTHNFYCADGERRTV